MNAGAAAHNPRQREVWLKSLTTPRRRPTVVATSVSVLATRLAGILVLTRARKRTNGGRQEGFGNMRGGMGKKSRKRKEKNPWESDGSGVPSWAQEVPWSDGSSAEEQFDAIKKDELMENRGRK